MVYRLVRQSCRKLHRPARRTFSSNHGNNSSSSDVPNISLTQPLPGLPPAKFTSATNHRVETQVTVLENGMKVATENKFGQFCTVGVLINSGSRYEVAYPSGISHFLEKLAFNSTTKFTDKDKILQELEKHGGICDCQSSRDTLIYAMSADTRGLPSVVDVLSEVINRPSILPEELEDARTAIGFQAQFQELDPNPENVLMEMIHGAAYRCNTLGLPHRCPLENTDKIDKSILYTYMKNFHTPERMVLAGVGMDHDYLVNIAKEHFVENTTPIWLEQQHLINTKMAKDDSLAQYTGGKVLVEKDLSSVSLGPTPMPELAHIVIGLESCSHRDDDFISFCVLNMMMGGGGSFSAGGPGKGMYTRLYLNVLNRFHWIHNATCYNHAYEDSGLFCIHASSHPDQLADLVDVITKEIVNTASSPDKTELNRAKTQLQSMLLMNLESRPVIFEDIGRQVLSNGERKQPEYYYNCIEKVTAEDIQRVANRMLRSKLSLAGYGTLANLPDYENIQNSLLGKVGKLRRFSFFG